MSAFYNVEYSVQSSTNTQCNPVQIIRAVLNIDVRLIYGTSWKSNETTPFF